MKKTILVKTQDYNFVYFLLAALLLSPALASAKVNNSSFHQIGHSISLNDTIVLRKLPDNKNFEFYSSSGKQTSFYSSKLKQKKVYRFYLFDLDGNLVAENNIINRQGIQFTNMKRGNYYFKILSNDERIEDGSLIIK
jgi:hypothetical protein